MQQSCMWVCRGGPWKPICVHAVQLPRMSLLEHDGCCFLPSDVRITDLNKPENIASSFNQ